MLQAVYDWLFPESPGAVLARQTSQARGHRLILEEQGLDFEVLDQLVSDIKADIDTNFSKYDNASKDGDFSLEFELTEMQKNSMFNMFAEFYLRQTFGTYKSIHLEWIDDKLHVSWYKHPSICMNPRLLSALRLNKSIRCINPYQ